MRIDELTKQGTARILVGSRSRLYDVVSGIEDRLISYLADTCDISADEVHPDKAGAPHRIFDQGTKDTLYLIRTQGDRVEISPMTGIAKRCLKEMFHNQQKDSDYY